MLDFKKFINSNQEELIEALRNEGYNRLPDMRDEEGNHFIIVHKDKENIGLELMVKKEDASANGLNKPIEGMKDFYVEELAKTFKVIVMNGGRNSPTVKTKMNDNKNYYITELTEGPKIYNIKEISQEEVDQFFENNKDIKSWSQEKRIYNMVIRNGLLLENYLQKMSGNSSKDNLSDLKKILEQANKYLFDYCSSISTYIDMVEKILTKKGAEKLEAFRKDCSSQYDQELAYRFFCRLRQYIVHYDFPLVKITSSFEGNRTITCSKEALLRFSKWNTVKQDIEQMNEEIDILPMIKQANVSITVLHLQFLYYYAEYIENMVKASMEFNKRYGIKVPVILMANSREAIGEGKFTMKPIFEILAELQEAMKDCLHNPNITIEKDENSPPLLNI